MSMPPLIRPILVAVNCHVSWMAGQAKTFLYSCSCGITVPKILHHILLSTGFTMPLFKKDDASIYYEIRGRGYPLLLLPPGGMDATIDFWQRTAFNAVEVFCEDFRV